MCLAHKRRHSACANPAAVRPLECIRIPGSSGRSQQVVSEIDAGHSTIESKAPSWLAKLRSFTCR